MPHPTLEEIIELHVTLKRLGVSRPSTPHQASTLRRSVRHALERDAPDTVMLVIQVPSDALQRSGQSAEDALRLGDHPLSQALKALASPVLEARRRQLEGERDGQRVALFSAPQGGSMHDSPPSRSTPGSPVWSEVPGVDSTGHRAALGSVGSLTLEAYLIHGQGWVPMHHTVIYGYHLLERGNPEALTLFEASWHGGETALVAGVDPDDAETLGVLQGWLEAHVSEFASLRLLGCTG